MLCNVRLQISLLPQTTFLIIFYLYRQLQDSSFETLMHSYSFRADKTHSFFRYLQVWTHLILQLHSCHCTMKFLCFAGWWNENILTYFGQKYTSTSLLCKNFVLHLYRTCELNNDCIGRILCLNFQPNCRQLFTSQCIPF